MSKQYLYEIGGGCGRTTFKLNIDNDKFNGEFEFNWMGGNNIKCMLEGRVVKNTDRMLTLYTDEIIDVKTTKKYNCATIDIMKKNISSVTFRLFDIVGTTEFDTLDHQFDGMVMGGCDVNKDATYHAVLIACYGERFGAENYGANKDKGHKDDTVDKLCKHMHYLPLRDMSVPINTNDKREDLDSSED